MLVAHQGNGPDGAVSQGGYLYYSRTRKRKQYPILCRKTASRTAREEVILDQNELAKGEKFFAIGDMEVSDDGNLLAYTTDVTGFREYTLAVKDLRTGKVGSERIAKVSSLAWAADNRTLFYVTDDAAKRPYRVSRHAARTDPATDALLFEEKDERFSLDVSRSRSLAYVFVVAGSLTSTEIRFLPAAEPSAALSLIAPREKDREYDVDHRGDLFYIRVNDRGRNFRLVTAPVSDPRPAGWKEGPARESMHEGTTSSRTTSSSTSGGRLRRFAVRSRPTLPTDRFPRAGVLLLLRGTGIRHALFRFRTNLRDPVFGFDSTCHSGAGTSSTDRSLAATTRRATSRRLRASAPTARDPISIVYAARQTRLAHRALSGYALTVCRATRPSPPTRLVSSIGGVARSARAGGGEIGKKCTTSRFRPEEHVHDFLTVRH